ncbi:hypothetical protein O181_037519 [Austropuccinia psidii MF-1]|uniref:Reverse transcriptase Ty1/copia-type domain-containing protein n=1 Tax=Austropuccinia psidii MF-1 TaxID=1389203 RepID=A0A9Q3D6P9_9BASI|nr:hypothetical protein [Austropuccinia psidii MF-1]
MDPIVHAKQVNGFEVPGKEGWVWCLNKSLYGTKQATRMWQAKLTQVLKDLGMNSTRANDSLYTNDKQTMFLHVHVDDGFLIGKSEQELLRFLKELHTVLKLKDSDMEKSLPVKSPCNRNLLKELEAVNEPVAITGYQQVIGSLNYLAQHTQPDILFTVNSLSCYSTYPSERHWVALKHLLRYLNGTSQLCMYYSRDGNEKG